MNVTATSRTASPDRPAASTPPTGDEATEEGGGGFERSGSLFSTADGDQRLGDASARGRGPGYAVDREAGEASATLVDAGFDVTVARTTERRELDRGRTIEGTGTVGTVNAHVDIGAELSTSGAKAKGHAKASAGAEAMLVDVKIEGSVSITAKTIGDLLSGAYNEIVDPIVDRLAGRDVAGMPEVPASWDHGVVLGGHVEGGYGASLKGGVGVELDDGARLSAKGKLGLGPVIGAGVTVGVK